VYADYPQNVPADLLRYVERPGERLCRKCLSWLKVSLFQNRRCRPCRSAHNTTWRRLNPDLAAEIRKKQNAHSRRVRRIARQVAESNLSDAALKALAQHPPDLDGDPERLAYLRGYLSGAAQREQTSKAVEEHMDLVFRIASENARKFRGALALSYEDCVSAGYHALIRGLASAAPPTRAQLALKIRSEIIDEHRRRFGRLEHSGTPARRAVEGALTGLRTHESDEGLVEHLSVSAPEPAGLELEETVMALDIPERDKQVCLLVSQGYLLREIGERFGITESRVCGILREIRETHGSALAELMT
jgi:hypothetical protein